MQQQQEAITTEAAVAAGIAEAIEKIATATGKATAAAAIGKKAEYKEQQKRNFRW